MLQYMNKAYSTVQGCTPTQPCYIDTVPENYISVTST